jgi:thymidylate synthase
MSEQNLVTLGKEAKAELTEKKSVFIGHAAPVRSAEEAENFVLGIRKKHADARHNVFAYTVRSAVRCSDDGEPKGTGGVPVLEVLKKSGVDRAVIVVTRYFGGILLGAPGLVRAYSRAAAMAVEAAGIVTYRSYTECTVACEYSFYDRLMYEIGRRDILVDGTDFADSITLRLAVLSEEYEAFCETVFSMTGGKTMPRRGADRFDGRAER